MSESKFEYEAEIYPNTGHHYYFYPIMLDNNPRNLKLSNESKNFLEKYLPIEYTQEIRTELNSWIEKSYHAWFNGTSSYEYMKCHVEQRHIEVENHHFDVIGLNLCIESNLGTMEDGIFPNEFPEITLEQENNRRENYETVYVATDKAKLQEKIAQDDFKLDLTKVFPSLFNVIKEKSNEDFQLDMLISWGGEKAELEAIGVNLVIDYGNSRTVSFAMDMQNAGIDQEDLKDRCVPIFLNDTLFNAQKKFLFQDNDLKYDLGDVIVDSWFTLSNPGFSPLQISDIHTEVRKKMGKKNIFGFSKAIEEKVSITTDREAYMFCEVSPAELGKKAYELAVSAPIDEVGKYSLSSPKRYMWDTDKQSIVQYWSMLEMGTNNAKVKIKGLKGKYLGFIHPDWSDPEFYETAYCHELLEENESCIELDRNPANFRSEDRSSLSPKEVDFPTCDAMIMSALAILEKANRQIMSESYRYKQNPNPRYIKQITLSFPTGWTDKEYYKFEDAWQKAKNIFLWSNYTEEKLEKHQDLTVVMGMNEAVSSALPIVFSEVNHFGYKVDKWIDTFAQKGRSSAVRVLTMDIGGGTQDISIIDYIDATKTKATKAKIQLNYNTIFSDSSRNAGDKLVQKLLEEVFFPYLTKDLNDDELLEFQNQLHGSNDRIADTNLRAIVNRTVLIPIIVDWLKKCNIDTSSHESGVTDTIINQCGVSFEHLRVFNSWFTGLNIIKLTEDDTISVNYSDIYECIESWIKESILEPILLFEGFECDLLIVSGKPSELAIVQKIIKEYFPITSNEIIFVKNYYAGNWLPYTDNSGGIKDAKLVTVMGGLLAQSLELDIFSNWKSLDYLKPDDKQNQKPKYFWGVYGEHQEKQEILLEPEETEQILFVASNIDIGRFLFKGGNVQKIYELRCLNGESTIDNPIEVTLKRTGTEELEITSVSGKYEDGTKANLNDFELLVNTLENKTYWLDNPRFSFTNRRERE